MSYDIYCYRSKTGKPDVDEAAEVLLTDTSKWSKKIRYPSTKLAIVKRLIAFNPKLEALDFHYGKIAKLTETIIEKEKDKFNQIEINTLTDDHAIRLSVYDNHVFITVPYWYREEQAVVLFQDIKSYIKIIRETAGYFVFDPQTGEAFDPAESNFDGLEKYVFVTNDIQVIINDTNVSKHQAKKTWWKFW